MDNTPDFIYSEGLRRLRRVRKATWYIFIGWFLLLAFFVILFIRSPSSAKYMPLIAFGYLATFLIVAYYNQYARCPKCSQHFNKKRSPWNKKCQNCGIELDADRFA